MPFLNGFDADIFVEGLGTSPAYGIVIDEPQSTLTCWIPSEVGRYYKVTWSCPKHFMESRGDVYIDGLSVGSEVIRRDFKAKMDGNPSVAEKKPFIFLQNSDSQIGEDSMDTVTGDSSVTTQHPEHGEVRIIIHRLDMFNRTPQARRDPSLAEKIEHIATFVFKYRSLAFLVDNGIKDKETVIIPRVATDTSEQNDVNMEGVEDDSVIDSKIQELQGQLNELYAKKHSKEQFAGTKGRFRRPQTVVKSQVVKAVHRNYLPRPERIAAKKAARKAAEAVRRAADKQKLEEEARLLPPRPKSLRIERRRQAGADAVPVIFESLRESGSDEGPSALTSDLEIA